MGVNKIKLGVLISGEGTNLQAIIDSAESGCISAQVAVVVSDSPNAPGLLRAKRHGIAAFPVERGTFASRGEFETRIVDILKRHGAELVCLAGFMRIIGNVMLDAFPGRVINIHPALLPAFPGLNAQEQALKSRAKVTGCTVHFVDEKMDNGPVICQSTVPVREDDTLDVLKERILKEEHQIYPKAIQMIAKGEIRNGGML